MEAFVNKRSGGSLAIVGSGITAISQMTLESVSYVRYADVVFYHATNGVTATQIRELNNNTVDLYEYYGEDKRRNVTYVQMAELMLREVRAGKSVVGVFHGHPGFFVSPGRRALAIAEDEGYPTLLLPAVSATDCMFADLRVDPGVFGCQILMASRIFDDKLILAKDGHVVLLQISAVRDPGFSFTGYRNAAVSECIELLTKTYGEAQEAIYYMAALFPAFPPEISVHHLADYRDPEVLDMIGAGLLYLPPSGSSLSALRNRQAFGNKAPYGPLENQAVRALDDHKTPAEFRRREASGALYEAMTELGVDPTARDEYRRCPQEFVARFPKLSPSERRALLKRSGREVRGVSTRVS